MKALVTGGGGFLGKEITRQLLARGDEVTVLGRGRYPEVEAWGARGLQRDLTQDEDLQAACEGMDVVFHAAAKAGFWGRREDFYAANVTATQNIARAARAAGVARFVHTSSPSVVFGRGGHDALDASEEDCPYPDAYDSYYPETKAIAERWILEESDEGFATTALRPHLIWGPGDPHLLPRLVDRHEKGRLAQIGDGTNKVSFTFIENAAVAHLQAADALAPGSANAGRAYFICDDEPVLFWKFANQLLQGVGLPAVKRRVSYPLARRLVSALYWTWNALGIEQEPPMSPFVVDQLAHSHWYSTEAAKRDFGYATVVSHDEAFQRTVSAFAGQLHDRAAS